MMVKILAKFLLKTLHYDSVFEVKEGLDDRNKDQGDFFNLKKKQLLIKMTMILKALVAIMAKVCL